MSFLLVVVDWSDVPGVAPVLAHDPVLVGRPVTFEDGPVVGRVAALGPGLESFGAEDVALGVLRLAAEPGVSVALTDRRVGLVDVVKPELSPCFGDG